MKKLILLLSISLSASAEITYVPEDGDIIFHKSHSDQSVAFQLATKSPFSHVGIIIKDKNSINVLEAEDKVRLTPLNEWMLRGNGKYVVKRLAKPLTKSQKRSLRKDITSKYLEKPYDPYFEWGDDKLYCSELVWLVFDNQPINMQLSTLRELRSFDIDNPIVRAKLNERFGDKIPYDARVVSPADIFDSKQLVEVFRKI